MSDNNKKSTIISSNENNRASIEIQQINANVEPQSNNTQTKSYKTYPQLLNDEKQRTRKPVLNNSNIINKSVSPTRRHLFNSNNSQQQQKSHFTRSSKSPVKNRRKKFDEFSGDVDNFESLNADDNQYYENYDENNDDEMMNMTNYDKDDSLLDVESIGKQTPFRMDSIDTSFSVFGTGIGYNNVLSSLNEEPIKIKSRLSRARNKMNINNNDNKEKFFHDEVDDDNDNDDDDDDEGYELNNNENNNINQNRYSIIETEYLDNPMNDENNNNNNNNNDVLLGTADTGYQGTASSSNLNKVITKNPLIKNKNLSFAKKLNLIDHNQQDDDNNQQDGENRSFNETDTIDEILLIADDGKVEDLEKEYKKIKKEEREELILKKQKQNQHHNDLYLLENEALNTFKQSIDLFKDENNTLYDIQGRDDYSQSYTFDLPAHILSNKPDPPRSRTPSRIPTPVRNKSATSSYKTGRLQTNPSPLTIGSRIPILVNSRPQSRADMYPPINETKNINDDNNNNFKNIQKGSDKDNNDIQQSLIIDQIYFKRSDNFNESENKTKTEEGELSNLLDEGLPDKMFEASILTGGALTSRTNNDASFNNNNNIKQNNSPEVKTPTNTIDTNNKSNDKNDLQSNSTSNVIAGAFKFYTEFADNILADTGDVDNDDASISYNAVLNNLNSKDKEKKQSKIEETQKRNQNEKLDNEKQNKKPTIAQSKSPTKFQTTKNTHSISPFISIEKQQEKINNNNNNNNRKTPILKNNTKSSQSTYKPNSTASNNNEKQKAIPPIPNKNKRDSITSSNQALNNNNRPPTREVTYSVDSEEASITENSKLDLKVKLREEQKRRKMTDELLDQLQNNYDRLLEKHALAENVIDSLRLGAKLQIHQDTIPNTIQQGSLVNQQQSQIISSQLFPQSQASLINLNTPQTASKGLQQVISSTTSTNQPLTTTTTTSSIKTSSNTPTNQITSDNENKNDTNLKDFIRTVSAPEEYLKILADQISSNTYNDQDPVKILAAQQSKLGLLFQTKALEDKMQSFITLMDEKQLSVIEQRQVYDSIKQDYETLLKTYSDAKKNDPNGFLPNELDLDIDLNKELEKMKDLLNDIVKKLTDNLIGQSPSGSVSAPDRKSSLPTSSISSYGNHDEIMDQYNRLLDIFNIENNSKDSKKNDPLKHLTNQEPMSQQKKLQLLQEQQQQQQQHQNRLLSASRQSIISNYTTGSNIPISGIDGIIGSENDLGNEYGGDDDDLKTFSTATVNRVITHENNGRKTALSSADDKEKNNEFVNSSSIMTSDPNLYKNVHGDDTVDNEEDDTMKQYFSSNRNQLLSNNKRNNKVLSKISASSSKKLSSNEGNNQDEKTTYDKTGTNLVVNNQLERNNSVVVNDGTSGTNLINNSSKSKNRYRGVADTPGRSNLVVLDETNSDDDNNRLVSQINNPKEQQNRNLDDSIENILNNNDEDDQSNIDDVRQNSNRQPIKVNNKKSSLLNNQSPNLVKPSAFTITNGKESQSSNENIDNGYHTMTHTTPHHHLMEDEIIARNGSPKVDKNKQLQKYNQKQQQNLKVYNDETKYRKHDRQHSEIDEKSQSEDESISRNSPSLHTKTLDSGFGSMAASKKRDAAKARGKEIRKSEEHKYKNTLPNRKDIDKLSFNNLRNSKDANGQRAPVAKAYEGSDSGEEIDDLVVNQRFLDSASTDRNRRVPFESQNVNSISKNHATKRSSIDDDRNYNDNMNDSYYELPIETRNYNRKNKEPKLRENKRMTRNYESQDENIHENEENTSSTSDASSVIYRGKPLKTSKSEIMKILSEEVESLKNKLLEKQYKKAKTNVHPKDQWRNYIEEIENYEGEDQFQNHYKPKSGSKDDSLNHRQFYDEQSYLKRSRSLENVRQPRTSTIDEIDDEIYYNNTNSNIVRFGNEEFYKTADGRLIKIKHPRAVNARRNVLDTLDDPYETAQFKSSTIYDDAVISKYNVGKIQNDTNSKRNPHKKMQVYFADEVPYNGNESLASINNVHIPSGVVTITRNANNDLVYYDAKGNIIDVQPTSTSIKNKRKSHYSHKTKLNDSNYSNDGTTFMDSGYNTTINASTRSQRNTPISHIKSPYHHLVDHVPVINDDSTIYTQTNPLILNDAQRQYADVNNHNSNNKTENTSTLRHHNSPNIYNNHPIITSTLMNHHPLNVIDQNTIPNGINVYSTTSDVKSNKRQQQQKRLILKSKGQVPSEYFIKHVPNSSNQPSIINTHPIEYVQAYSTSSSSIVNNQPLQSTTNIIKTPNPVNGGEKSNYTGTYIITKNGERIPIRLINNSNNNLITENIPTRLKATNNVLSRLPVSNIVNNNNNNNNIPINTDAYMYGNHALNLIENEVIPQQIRSINTRFLSATPTPFTSHSRPYLCPICDHTCVHRPNDQNINTDNYISTSMVFPRKKVRYYIREYGDASSDNEILYRKTNVKKPANYYYEDMINKYNDEDKYHHIYDNRTITPDSDDIYTKEIMNRNARLVEGLFKRAFRYAYKMKSKTDNIINDIIIDKQYNNN